MADIHVEEAFFSGGLSKCPLKTVIFQKLAIPLVILLNAFVCGNKTSRDVKEKRSSAYT